MKELALIKKQMCETVSELCDAARLSAGDIFVIGCSTSEVLGAKIGTDSAPELGVILAEAALSVLRPRGIYLAAQCCEHLNRALVIERAALPYAEAVNVLPQPKAGGSFATAVYAALESPVLLEHIKASAGLDIGGTLIGMHLREVAVPVRLSHKQIGEASLIAARTRPKFIGGSRAVYDEALL